MTCTKLTQLHDASLVTRVSVTKLIGCRAAVRTVQFANCSSVQFSSSTVNTALVNPSVDDVFVDAVEGAQRVRPRVETSDQCAAGALNQLQLKVLRL